MLNLIQAAFVARKCSKLINTFVRSLHAKEAVLYAHLQLQNFIGAAAHSQKLKMPQKLGASIELHVQLKSLYKIVNNEADIHHFNDWIQWYSPHVRKLMMTNNISLVVIAPKTMGESMLNRRRSTHALESQRAWTAWLACRASQSAVTFTLEENISPPSLWKSPFLFFKSTPVFHCLSKVALCSSLLIISSSQALP